ncbi:hypothetical protein FRACYDRAFT_251548 [Fragilariopsis cylindrus CCMP1102]|uniref:F-box domain-containing protein n=1 Tax=Fragilariopsis cylindrus CCMP1102 TaxID=635003 RepID=A0A1E7EMP6_9STRA|nr:hypothetical protein FRACYDRAFT_251548 [Fragilariopsis cylindrus CCMP1102]|eukprot:OEU07208.1 hypothetical protein FRACYDRAFT_251548 [Fragilariopsis cylindrus CCMP1102]
MALTDSNKNNSKNIMSEGGHHEIEAAKKLCLATAKSTASSASTMMDSARSMAATAKKNEATAERVVRQLKKQQQAMAAAAVWNTIPIPIKIEIVSYLDQESLISISPPRHGYGRSPPCILSKILPKVRELDLSTSDGIVFPALLKNFHLKNFPLLEKFTANNLLCFALNGSNMRFCNSLKEIYMDHSSNNYLGSRQKDKISDLNNHHEIFLFHYCCKALERVSIRNLRWGSKACRQNALTQNVLIKFVRNAPPSLHWFRSDLTPDNIRMLRMERPGIKLLN